MLLVALTPSYTDGGTIATKMAGVILASVSSGAGELCFLGLTHYYGPFSLAAWGSGTGGAGLIGAGMYSLLTTSLGLSSKKTLLASAFLPMFMLLGFFVVLPHGPLRRARLARPQDSAKGLIQQAATHNEQDDERVDAHRDSQAEEEEGLLAHSPLAKTSSPLVKPTWFQNLTHNLRRSRSLFIP